MLRIYPVCLELLRELRPYVRQIAERDRSLARQIDDASASTVLNLAEGSGATAGRRRNAYVIALSEAREALSGLEIAVARRYIREVEPPVRPKYTHDFATLVPNVSSHTPRTAGTRTGCARSSIAPNSTPSRPAVAARQHPVHRQDPDRSVCSAPEHDRSDGDRPSERESTGTRLDCVALLPVSFSRRASRIRNRIRRLPSLGHGRARREDMRKIARAHQDGHASAESLLRVSGDEHTLRSGLGRVGFACAGPRGRAPLPERAGLTLTVCTHWHIRVSGERAPAPASLGGAHEARST